MIKAASENNSSLNFFSDIPMEGRGLLWGFALALAFFLIIFQFLPLYLQADDFHYAMQAYSSTGLQLSDFGPYFSRFPIWCLLTWAGFSLHLDQFSFLYGIPVFSLFGGLFLLIRRMLGRSLLLKEFLLVFVLTFWPNWFEMIYWATALSYCFAILLWGLGATVSSYKQKLFFYLCAGLTFESTLVAIALFEFLLSFRKGEITRLKVWLANITGLAMSYLAIRLLLVKIRTESLYSYQLNFAASNIAHQAAAALKEMYSVRFYETLGLPTAMELVMLALLIQGILKSKHHPKQTEPVQLPNSIAFTVVYFSSFTYWIYYHAPRALFAYQVLFIVVLFYVIAQRLDQKRSQLLSILLATVTLTGTSQIIYVKWKNRQIMDSISAALTNDLRLASIEEQRNFLDHEADKIAKDWVLHPDYRDYYLRYLRNRYKLD